MFEAAQENSFAPGQCAAIFIGGKKSGVIGKVDEDVLDRWDIKQRNILFAQVEMEQFCAKKKKHVQYVPVSGFPAVSRDISLAVKTGTTAHDIKTVIRKTIEHDKEIILENLKFIEKYEGDKIAKDQRGLVFSLVYRSRLDRTLRDEEVADIHEKVCNALVKDLDIVIR